nr:uncharacterized protein LOC121502887 [Drosophila kikkawai]
MRAQPRTIVCLPPYKSPPDECQSQVMYGHPARFNMCRREENTEADACSWLDNNGWPASSSTVIDKQTSNQTDKYRGGGGAAPARICVRRTRKKKYQKLLVFQRP